jgi:putative component of membrane protein insertase Oxa1/YidC/SpoIIIJ protein YidD
MRIVYLILIFFLYAGNSVSAQSWKDDADLLLSNRQVSTAPAIKEPSKGFNPGKIMYNISMGFYQKHISAQMGTNCIYETTCSRFSRKLVSEYGVVKGFFLSLDRVGRCNKLAYAEASPLRLNREGKIIEYPLDFKLRK